MLRKLLLLGIIILLSINPSSAVEIRENKEAWTCYDNSINYEKLNGWDCVTISENQYFKGVSHMVNYQLEGENLIIHDELYKMDYTIYDYKNSGLFFHFWFDVKPVRNYKFLWDNSP
jgi:hypothetical protein